MTYCRSNRPGDAADLGDRKGRERLHRALPVAAKLRSLRDGETAGFPFTFRVPVP